ncbi:TPA: hypothetical protein DD449_04450 [Candidatus Berkelbacteria bacterium]|uniref:Uncharacterized protein n=1 Tax=Berkelbacteria bacterium GW2011_GWE1_39_12 TaxID=1618337 RepID=A0A0G4B423_9BACT|nr:MAG: hypothetical protein UT28_C0001G0510 [Berkelbacteria bacterium GW2011_GWE1_39_12]HBO60906.1 hypothetical protein [Candidatus Berkelbacteria bacterium]
MGETKVVDGSVIERRKEGGVVIFASFSGKLELVPQLGDGGKIGLIIHDTSSRTAGFVTSPEALTVALKILREEKEVEELVVNCPHFSLEPGGERGCLAHAHEDRSLPCSIRTKQQLDLCEDYRLSMSDLKRRIEACEFRCSKGCMAGAAKPGKTVGPCWVKNEADLNKCEADGKYRTKAELCAELHECVENFDPRDRID